MAMGCVKTGRGTQQGNSLALADQFRQLVDEVGLFLHLFEVSAAVVVPADGVAVFAVEVGMQFLADILAAPVDRPAVMETTALGAAYLAGRAAGLCPDLPGFAATWKRERRFEPQMDAATRARKTWRASITCHAIRPGIPRTNSRTRAIKESAKAASPGIPIKLPTTT